MKNYGNFNEELWKRFRLSNIRGQYDSNVFYQLIKRAQMGSFGHFGYPT